MTHKSFSEALHFSMSGIKRPATSPLLVETDKRNRASDSFDSFEEDLEATILSSTRIHEMSIVGDGTTPDLVGALKAALKDAAFLEALSDAVTGKLKSEISTLKRELVVRDEKIAALEDKIEDLEQYQRRNNVRISGIPENKDENTDAIIEKVAEAIGCVLPEGAIDRSHRVGRPGATTGPRPLLVKFVSYKSKRGLMSCRKNLKSKSGAQILPGLKWSGEKVFLNDDLTAVRAKVAKAARDLKKQQRVDETWVWDGVVFVKRRDTVHRVSSLRQLHSIVS